MASVLDLVKHYQHAIEKYSDDERKVLKCIDKLFHLNVTVQHLQETGVGRTVNALRKEPGNVGQASRALVNKWKCMVAAEESDNEPEQNNDASQHNGHGNGKDSDSSANNSGAAQTKPNDSTSGTKSRQEDHRQMNGGQSGNKRKYNSSEDEETHTKKSKHNSSSDTDDYKKPSSKVKVEESKSDDQDTSQSDDSDSDSSQSSKDERPEQKVKHEPKERSSSSKHSENNVEHKRESSSTKKSSDSDKQSSHRSKHSTDKPKDTHKHNSSKEKENGTEKKHKSDHKTDIDKRHKTESGSSSKHSEDKHRSSSHRSESSSDKHKIDKSRSEKHRSSSQSNKIEKDKHKHSDKEASEKRKDESSSKHSSSKEKKESSREKSSSHKSGKSHSSSSESKSKSDKKEKSYDKDQSKHKSSSSRSSKSSKTKEEIPKKDVNGQNDSDDGIDCGSGASFAEALGMISPTKSKKKPFKDMNSPSNPFNNIDLSPASLLAPNAKLAPLPQIEISALPEISPNYKPRPPPKLMPHFTEEDAMSQVISSKNQRTKVYSGNKVYGKLPSLYELCVNVLQEHIDALEFTGGVPYDILKPVIDKATPQQLFMLEHYNPYLMEDTDHLWKGFCERNFRNKKRQEMESWREMFIRCQEEQESKLKSLTANIKMTQEARKAPIKQTKMAYVDSVVKPPRNIARKQAQHGTAHAAAASPAARVASLAAAPNVLKGGVRPSNAAPVSLATFNKPKKAPLMQKALQFMRGRKR